ncbi:hypothetical protein Pint_19974 [Pistacia integerrima]|uniref:Uncharacterized protein n=1 Tax=Pistacia integerrima TaxID=434235 RepID=A0ACC0XDU8_9ROSI|nr:hypothetical protein Pint_19974 [Pistacia integerrima]
MATKPWILQIFAFVSLLFPVTYSIDFNFRAVFNFGDSNSDTGALIAAGFERIDPPFGQIYFRKPSGRYSDGRLIIDFLMDAMDLPFLNAYLDSIGAPSFQKGCNFAAAGSTILPANPTSVSPFSFGIQVNQFLRFKRRVLELLAKGKKLNKFIPSEDYFRKGLYMFDIGQNDLAGAFYSKTLDQIVASIPTILVEFETGIKNVAKFGTDPSKLDEQGCVSGHNQAAKLFNIQLHALCFEQPIMACCGVGGPPLNYDSRISCGQTKVINGITVTAKACPDSTEYVSWDGIHFTEAANQYVSSQILTGKYSDPPFSDKMPFILNLKF